MDKSQARKDESWREGMLRICHPLTFEELKAGTTHEIARTRAKVWRYLHRERDWSLTSIKTVFGLKCRSTPLRAIRNLEKREGLKDG